MRPANRFSLCLGLLAGVLFALAGAPAAQSKRDEVRGLWVLRSSLASPQSIAAMVRAARSAGFNTLLVQVRGRGEAYYRSAIEPRATELDGQRPDFDPLATTLQLARQAGLRVHAWVNVNLVASATTLPRSRTHVAFRHPEWLMVPAAQASSLASTDVRSPAYIGGLARWTRSADQTVEGLYLSPIPAAAQDYTASVLKELATGYALDGIHLDYVRYPTDTFDYSTGALAAFRAEVSASLPVATRQRLDRAAADDPAAWAKGLPDTWTTFRRSRLTELVSRLRTVVRAARPDAVLSAAVVPEPDAARTQRFQDWPAWAASGLLDVVCPMVYTPDAAEFTTQVARARSVLSQTPLWTGIGAYRLSANATADRIRTARREGSAGVLVFSYDSVSSTAQAAGYFAELHSTFSETVELMKNVKK